MPQILRIVKAKRATGVSLTSNVVELLAYSITMAYNFRLGTSSVVQTLDPEPYTSSLFVESAYCDVCGDVSIYMPLGFLWTRDP